MEKKTRKKKDIDVKLNVNDAELKVKRDVKGTEIDLDTRILDVHIDKTANEVKVEIEIDDKVIYEFVGNGESKHLPKGAIFKITGEMLKHFIKKGFGKLKK
jgi:hypothetical protein